MPNARWASCREPRVLVALVSQEWPSVPDDATTELEPGADTEDSADQPPSPKRSRAVWPLLALTVIVVLLAAFVARVFAIPSGSMELTLHGCTGCDNDHVLVDKLNYRFHPPQPGDVLVFAVPRGWHNSELPVAPPPANPIPRAMQWISVVFGNGGNRTDLIKRVIALGGETVSCCDARNRLLVDGKSLDEPYIYYAPEFGPARQIRFGPVRVPNGQLWMMGDSRNNSVDSRAEGNGPVPITDVIGKARMIVLPVARFGPIATGN